MKHSTIFLKQLTVFICFSLIFIYGSLHQRSVINEIELGKATYPILIYTYNTTAANAMLEFIEGYSSTVFFFTPECLMNLILEKYELTQFGNITDSLEFPYMIEAYLLTTRTAEKEIVIERLLNQHEENIIELTVNDRAWIDIDIKVNSLRNHLFMVEIFALLTYLFIQLFIRYNFCIKHKEDINALIISGINKTKLRKKEFFYNIDFVILSGLLLLIANFILYQYALFITEFKQIYQSPHLIKLIITNLTVIILQKSIYKSNIK
jgi:hypothetical protein